MLSWGTVWFQGTKLQDRLLISPVRLVQNMSDSTTFRLSKPSVPHAGGKVTIMPGPNNSYQTQFEHMSADHGMAMYQLAVSFDGRPLAVVPAGGIGSRNPPYPQPSILVFLISDAQQMWGRVCPQCRSYFRSDHVSGMTTCPYCTFAEDNIYFITEPQRQYLKKYVGAVRSVLEEKRQIEINLDEATDSPEWTYEERQLQHRFKCSACKVTTDVLGEYGSCPRCGKRNSGEVFHRKLNQIEADLSVEAEGKRSHLLNRLVSTFEAMANDLKRILTSIPSHARRREQVRGLNFQNIAFAVERLEDWYAFDLKEGLSDDDMQFAGLMFKRRHLFTHNDGRVDEKYLQETRDKSHELNEVVVVTVEEMSRLLRIVRSLGASFIHDVDCLE